jgi:hypothetical protein
MKAGARGTIVVVTICSWFAVSNHCAFAALGTKTEPVQTGCPFHSKPKEKPSAGAQCCKILRAVAPVTAKSWVRDDAKFAFADSYNSESATSAAHLQTMQLPLSLDTGPPGARSFAELILQRSLLAHAPPSLS